MTRQPTQIIIINKPYPSYSETGTIARIVTPDPPYYIVHFDDHVEFWSVEGEKIGECKVEQYE
jgi:hypothetical protein